MATRNLKIQPVVRRRGGPPRISDAELEEYRSTTPAPVKYELHQFSRNKIITAEIDPKVIDPYKYIEYPRSSNGQVTIDLNTETEFNRYMINLQVSKFENTKFNEIVNIDFEEFLPEPEPETETISTGLATLLERAEQFSINDSDSSFNSPLRKK
jgi:hypothetical protein